MVESHSIKERAYIFHIIDDKQIAKEEREKQKRVNKERAVETETEGEMILSLKGLVIPIPHVLHNVGKSSAFSESHSSHQLIRLIAHSRGTEVRKVRIQEGNAHAACTNGPHKCSGGP